MSGVKKVHQKIRPQGTNFRGESCFANASEIGKKILKTIVQH